MHWRLPVRGRINTKAPWFAGDEKDAGGDVLKIGKQEHELYFVAGRKAPFYERPDLNALPPGDLSKAAAHW